MQNSIAYPRACSEAAHTAQEGRKGICSGGLALCLQGERCPVLRAQDVTCVMCAVLMSSAHSLDLVQSAAVWKCPVMWTLLLPFLLHNGASTHLFCSSLTHIQHNVWQNSSTLHITVDFCLLGSGYTFSCSAQSPWLAVLSCSSGMPCFASSGPYQQQAQACQAAYAAHRHDVCFLFHNCWPLLAALPFDKTKQVSIRDKDKREALISVLNLHC